MNIRERRAVRGRGVKYKGGGVTDGGHQVTAMDDVADSLEIANIRAKRNTYTGIRIRPVNRGGHIMATDSLRNGNHECQVQTGFRGRGVKNKGGGVTDGGH